MAFKEVSDVIKSVQKRLGLSDELFVIMKVWTEVSGVDGSCVVGFKSGVVDVEASSSIIANEILLSKRQIISKLNQYIGSKKIKSLRLRIING
ncbi:MAG: DUF721 domain-containing protein [Elusimicrobia bacterium]|nr:DUF721 domain-containing protein [Elusimicrobiota bacterium]